MGVHDGAESVFTFHQNGCSRWGRICKPIAISARAIVRAGKGHKYWSAFSNETAGKIEELAGSIHSLLFDPELKSPIKTLDLPLGGSRGVRTAVQTLIDICLISNRNQQGLPKRVEDTEEDFTGSSTVGALKKTLALVERITGNSPGSLGLHPAVFFYGPTGRHSGPMFMGTVDLFGSKLANNDQTFFKRFTSVRCPLEELLILHKDLIATVLQKNISPRRISAYAKLLEEIIKRLGEGNILTESDIVSIAGLEGKLVVGSAVSTSKEFSDDTKSKVFLNTALSSAIKCPICSGYLDASKSATYDHIHEKQHGGGGSDANCQLVHPYCNSAVKNNLHA